MLLTQYFKRRREDVQPIRHDLSDLLRDWLADKPRGVHVFQMPHKPVELISRDLEDARDAWLLGGGDPSSDFLSYTDHTGNVADFHSLRHTFVSRLVNSGASVKVCQDLARHSTPNLTIGRYAHALLNDLTEALDNLPGIDDDSEKDSARLRKTGTSDPAWHPQQIRQQLARNSQRSGATGCEKDALSRRGTDKTQGLEGARVSATMRRGTKE